MKILCSCGAKFAVDVTPEMVQRPVQFICPSCGVDSSSAVNELIRQELATQTEAAVPTVIAAEPIAASAIEMAPAPKVGARLHVSRAHAPVATAAAPEISSSSEICLKHPGHEIGHHCLVCNKPMCPKCMELFGYVCSPFCKTKAEAKKIHVPQYAGQKSVSEARQWRKIGAVTSGIAALLALFVGAWIWFAWFGSHPKPVFAVPFPNGIHSGQSEFVGKDQLVFRHGLTLSRYDLKARKEVWSCELVSKKEIEDAIAAETKATQARIKTAQAEGWSRIPSMPSVEELREDVERSLAATMQMYVHGSNVWVASDSGKMVRHEWESGNAVKEIPVVPGYHETAREGEDLMFQTRNRSGQRVINHVNLVTAETRSETLGPPLNTTVATAGGKKTPAGPPPAGYKPVDASKLAEEAQNASLPGKIALPALAANAMNQDRLMREINAEEIAEYARALGSDSGLGDFS
ncbi:MAG: hypothetical protein H7Y43_04245, partial [Akkermansiaceae bacterium]|nr:hypothetical protein [Verrucomicrobiales bacterium]